MQEESQRAPEEPHWSGNAFLSLSRAFFNPSTILGLFGPLILQNAFKLTNADFISRAVMDGRSPTDNPLGPKEIVGIVDYSIQYYTTVIVCVFWLFAWVPTFSQLLHGLSSKKAPLINPKTIYTFGFGVLLLIWLCIFLFTGQVANADVLQIYIKANTNFGEMHLPPMTLLFFTRVGMALHIFFMRLYPLKEPQTN